MNRHPVDRMGDLKEQIEVLQEEYAMWRNMVLNREVEATGTEYHAEIKQRNYRSMDYKLAEKILPTDTYSQLVCTAEHPCVILKKSNQ